MLLMASLYRHFLLISFLSFLPQYSSICLYCQCHCLFKLPVHSNFINMAVICCIQFSHRYKTIRGMTAHGTDWHWNTLMVWFLLVVFCIKPSYYLTSDININLDLVHFPLPLPCWNTSYLCLKGTTSGYPTHILRVFPSPAFRMQEQHP